MTERAAPSAEEAFNPERSTAPWRRRLKASEPAAWLPPFIAAASPSAGAPRAAPRSRSGAASRAPGRARRDLDSRGPRRACRAARGMGERARLLTGEVALLVTDDWSADAHAAAVQALEPEALVVRTALPSGGPPASGRSRRSRSARPWRTSPSTTSSSSIPMRWPLGPDGCRHLPRRWSARSSASDRWR